MWWNLVCLFRRLNLGASVSAYLRYIFPVRSPWLFALCAFACRSTCCASVNLPMLKFIVSWSTLNNVMVRTENITNIGRHGSVGWAFTYARRCCFWGHFIRQPGTSIFSLFLTGTLQKRSKPWYLIPAAIIEFGGTLYDQNSTFPVIRHVHCCT